MGETSELRVGAGFGRREHIQAVPDVKSFAQKKKITERSMIYGLRMKYRTAGRKQEHRKGKAGSEPWQVKGKQAETAASRLRVRLKEELSRRMLDIKAV